MKFGINDRWVGATATATCCPKPTIAMMLSACLIESGNTFRVCNNGNYIVCTLLGEEASQNSTLQRRSIRCTLDTRFNLQRKDV